MFGCVGKVEPNLASELSWIYIRVLAFWEKVSKTNTWIENFC